MSTESPTKTIYRRDYQPPNVWISTIRLEFDLHETQTTVRAQMNCRVNPGVPAGPLVLDGESLKLISVGINGEKLESEQYEVTEESLIIREVPHEFQLETVVEINPEANSELSGLYRSSGMFCTQCEAVGFRRITYALDRPDVMATYEVVITADQQQYPVLLSNGNRTAQEKLPDGRHCVTWVDPFPKPSYLFALVAGDLRCHEGSFQTRSGRDVKLEIWVEPQNIDRCEHALHALQKSMKWDEETFGLEYDLDIYMIVAVNDFNMGAMENKGLNIFNSKYVLARPDTATDDDYELIEAVIAHEYFHNWTGNRVTCRDWFQLTLKEGLTVFRDQQYTADMTSPAVKRIQDVKKLRASQFPEDAGPMAHPIRPESYVSMDNFYTSTVYNKGAEVIRMYHTLLGDAGFRRGMDLYFQRHDNSAVTCDDFRAAMADANGVDLEQFGRWYSQAGTPVLDAEVSWDETSAVTRLRLTQGYETHPYRVPGTVDRQPLHLPVVVGFLDAAGNPCATTCRQTDRAAQESHLLQLKSDTEEFEFQGGDGDLVPSILRGFSAPVRLRMNRGRRELAFLMSHDVDPFNRWDAGQSLAMQVILDVVHQVQEGRLKSVDPVFAEAFGNTLVDAHIDGAFKSLLLSLPGESIVGQELEVVDPEAIHTARTYVMQQLAALYRQQLLQVYQDNRRDEPYRNDAKAIQCRRIKNLALEYLGTLQEQSAVDLAQRQYRSANNMTDQQHALSVLNELEVPEREQCLQAFYDQWRDDPLVLDKWFAMQAISHLSSTTERVAELIKHDDFVMKNPNRVRALIGVFGTMNQRCFHDRNGAGYRLVADVVIQADAFNPQMAARLVSAFNQWKRFDADRQQQMTDQLRRIQNAPGLSRDVAEIVERALGE